jgi:hypothetical protein
MARVAARGKPTCCRCRAARLAHTEDTQREGHSTSAHLLVARSEGGVCQGEGRGQMEGHKGRHTMGRGKVKCRTVVDDEVLHLVERGLVRHPAVADTHKH